MKLSIYLKKIDQHIPVDTLAIVGGNENDMAILDRLIDSYKPLSYSLLYGLTQSVNDAHAPVALAEGVDKIKTAAEKKLAAILGGTVKVRGSTAGGGLSPVANEAMKLAKALWKSKTDAQKAQLIGATRGQHESFIDKTDAEITSMILVAYTLAPETIAKAQALIAARKLVVTDVKIDLGALGLLPKEESEESDDSE